ncbi:MAG: tRNA (adenosine(37)-N6)-threonylcarbamoyltransferase complex ATPase subunit type 1 TsaE [Spirochaetaceae bacterium]|jgi:tRNA threonylcarbamoyladenosine biosynthesis protein TsaE|nr:tRNA (adenosine(37)-N6)-threonylcarbamoyltransferase complex ATPase subunit type 1 TsaE [Spirochaetaceae bacterium]
MPVPSLLCEIISAAPEETLAAGEHFAAALRLGSVVALRGGLGVGKTCFVKGLARGLNIKEEITSPTYTIVAEYAGTFPLYHIDVYRLNSDDDFDNLGISELFDRGITVIEWSERIPKSIPLDAAIVEIDIITDGKRRIRWIKTA